MTDRPTQGRTLTKAERDAADEVLKPGVEAGDFNDGVERGFRAARKFYTSSLTAARQRIADLERQLGRG